MYKIIGVVITLFISIQNTYADEYYIYKDDAGKKSMGNFVPALYAKNGYTVVDVESGQVIRTVEREMSEEEKEQFILNEKLNEERISALKEKERLEEELFRSYRTLNDVDKAEKNKIDSLDYLIVLEEKEINKLKSEIDKEKRDGRMNEYNGVSNNSVNRNIKTIVSKIGSKLSNIKSIEEEKLIVKEKYSKDRERLRKIIEIKSIL